MISIYEEKKCTFDKVLYKAYVDDHIFPIPKFIIMISTQNKHKIQTNPNVEINIKSKQIQMFKT